MAFLSAAVLLLLSGCSPTYNNSSTRILMDTVVNISADAEYSVISEAFALCENYEKMFSKTIPDSEISLLNSVGSCTVSDDTLRLIKAATVYGERTGGCFDITVGMVTSLWNFTDGVIPEQSAIDAALKTVDYKNIEFNGSTVNLNGSQVDLGGCAKGFVADRLHEFFVARGVEKAVINLGGNLYVMGELMDIGIKNPFDEGNIATLRVRDTAVVTAGTYERSFTVDNKLYHHILDTKTGYPVKTDLVSVTVISGNALEADILSTSLVIMGLQDGMDYIEKTEGVEALFITSDGEIHISSGIYCKDGIYRL